MPQLSLHNVARPGQLRIVHRAPPHDFDGVVDRRKRVAQFMRENGKELILVPIRFLQCRLGSTTHGNFILQSLICLLKFGIRLPQGKVSGTRAHASFPPRASCS